MNYDQFTGIIRAIVPAVVSYIVAKGYLTEDSAATVGAAMLALAAAIWSVLNNKSGKTIA